MTSPAIAATAVAAVRSPFGSAPPLLALLALLACYPVSMLLPRTWGWENGVLEVLQVLVLLASAVLALRAWRRDRPLPLAGLALCTAPVWLLLAARELSWGAVFAAPLAFGEHGPVFSSKLLWYKPLVAPLAGLVLALVLLQLWRRRLDRPLRRLVRAGGMPWLALALALLAEAGSSCAEGRLGCGFMAQLPHAMVFEELIELLAYLALVLAQAKLFGRCAATAAAPAFRAPVDAAP